MPTTTNYGWTTPADTDLVKDGASAIRTLGTAIDTTTKNLNPETTLGDIAYRSSTANVKTRLGLGTAGQVLTVNSGATAPVWATPSSGGMTLLSTTTLSGASTTISSISGSYKSLIAYIYNVNQGSDGDFMIDPNNSTNLTDSITNYGENGTSYALARSGNRIRTPGNVSSGNTSNAWTLILDNYASSTSFKPFNFYGYYEYTPNSIKACMHAGGNFRSTTAISSLVFKPSTGSFSGGTVLLYGVN